MHIPIILSKALKYSRRFIGDFRIAVDFGTANTRIAVFDKGVVLREPTFVGFNTRTNECILYGEEAKQIYGKAPNFIRVIKPVQNSIISDFDSVVLLIKQFFDKSVYPYLPRGSLLRLNIKALTAVPTTSTEVEQKAYLESLLKVGCSEVQLIDKPIASALGAELGVFSNNPSFIIDMGAGLVEMAVIISGGIVNFKTIKIAGDHMDKLIYNYLHLKYAVTTGELTSEKLKNSLFSLKGEDKTLTIRGKSLENGLPKSVRVKSADIMEALVGNLNQIIDHVKELLETLPADIIDGIIRSGITLTGGLANIPGIDKYMTAELKVPVFVAGKPQDSVINGLLKLLGDSEKMKRSVI